MPDDWTKVIMFLCIKVKGVNVLVRIRGMSSRGIVVGRLYGGLVTGGAEDY